jgi:hypothetical protein
MIFSRLIRLKRVQGCLALAVLLIMFIALFSSTADDLFFLIFGGVLGFFCAVRTHDFSNILCCVQCCYNLIPLFPLYCVYNVFPVTYFFIFSFANLIRI